MLADGIRKDYGPLMEHDEIRFIDLVKWGFRKKFYQQTLTLIESRAPAEFVEKGIYYYCSDEASKEHVIQLLAAIRADMKPYEYWKMDDIDHYFLKTYVRKAGMKAAPGEDLQRVYSRFRVKCLDSEDDRYITPVTACDDRELLENLLYAYYHIGDIRNMTNHAEDREEDTRLIVDEKDDSIRLVKITEAIEYFIRCYDAVTENIGDKEFNVVRISSSEVKYAAKQMEHTERNDREEPRKEQ